MSDKWYAKIIYSNEGVAMYEQFETIAEAEAYAKGFKLAKEIANDSDDDLLDEYSVCVDQIEPEDE